MCHNGTFIYDVVKKEFIHKVLLPTEDIECIIDMALQHGLYPFIYTLKDNTPHVFHSKRENFAEKTYFNSRIEAGDKRFIRDDDYTYFHQEDTFYISIVGPYDVLNDVSKHYEEVEGVVVTLAQDVYHDDFWWLEVMPKNAGKGNAVKFLRKLYKPEQIVCFGDNHNDVTMFQEADLGICTQNGVQALKDIAHHVIGTNNRHSVAKYIRKHHERQGK